VVAIVLLGWAGYLQWHWCRPRRGWFPWSSACPSPTRA
jgi:hypothetical protein